mmetsp:Transcript_13210/g.12782  ORF Transcript_13210/g.12782 Transcript_13210/m.12782 type:complete len:127 (-) Transcript_13210:75-455(-)
MISTLLFITVTFSLIAKSMQYVNSRQYYSKTLRFTEVTSKCMSTADNVIKIKQSTKRCESSKVERTKANGYKSTKVALVKYKDLFGDMLVTRAFITPIGNATWPEETWGMNLGDVMDRFKRGLPLV